MSISVLSQTLIFFVKEIYMSFMTTLKRTIAREAPVLLTVAGISGFVGGAFMVAKAAVEADKADSRYWRSEAPDGEWTRKEVLVQRARNMAPYFIPSVGVFLMSAGMIVAATHMGRYRHKALSSLYLSSLRYTKDLQSAIETSLPKKTAEEVLNKAQAPDKNPALLYVTSEDVLCWDSYSKRYFNAPSLEQIRGVVNDLNHVMYSEGWVSLNDYYWEIGLEPIEFGDQIGWAIESGPLELSFGTTLLNNNRACVTIKFEITPKHMYARLGG